MFYWFSLYVYLPTLPEYVRAQTASLTAVGVVLAMYGLWQGVVRIPLGVTVDATGRGKPFLVAGFLITGLGAMLMGVGRSVGMLTLGRAFTGVGAGTWVPLIVVFSSFFPAEHAVYATSLLTFSSSFGRVIATSITGFLNAIGGFPLSFFVSGGCAAAAIIIVLFIRMERRPVHAVSAGSILAIFARPDVLLPAFISAVGQIENWAVTFSFMPIQAANVGASEVVVGLLVALNLAGSTVANLLTAVVVRKITRTTLLYLSFAVITIGAVILAAAASVPVLFVGTIVMGIANGFSYPTLMGLSIERVDQSHRTTAMGIHQAVYSIGMFVGPWAGGVLSDALGIRWMIVIIAGFCLAACSALTYVRRRVLVRLDSAAAR